MENTIDISLPEPALFLGKIAQMIKNTQNSVMNLSFTGVKNAQMKNEEQPLRSLIITFLFFLLFFNGFLAGTCLPN